jgi:hypothetical protein
MQFLRGFLITLSASLIACKGFNRPPTISSFKKTSTATTDPTKVEPGKTSDASVEGGGFKAVESVTAFPRLSHTQWRQAAQDLLGLDSLPPLPMAFPDDPGNSDFGNNAGLLQVSSNLFSAYQSSAEALGDWVATHPASWPKILRTSSGTPQDMVSAFLLRAYRRPPTTDEVAAMVAIFTKGRQYFPSVEANGAGLAAMISVVLQSPYFIYRSEMGEASSTGVATLQPFELASRLSFALWNSLPDEELLKAAKDDKLKEPTALAAQVKRMLDDPRAAVTLDFFHQKLLKIDRFIPVVQDPKLFPEAKVLTPQLVQDEAKMFINEVVNTRGKGIAALLTEPITFVNSQTAPLYGVAKPNATGLQKVELNPQERAGILSQLGFLSSFSRPGDSNIFARGHYVTENLLCIELVGVPEPPKLTNDGTYKTQRELVTAATSAPSCVGCHERAINPPGFAMENYDAIGKWRIAEADGDAIDAASNFVLGNSEINFDGPVEFFQAISKRPELHRCYARRVAEYLYGRELDMSDASIVSKLSASSLKGMSAKELFILLLTNPQLGTRRQ